MIALDSQKIWGRKNRKFPYTPPHACLHHFSHFTIGLHIYPRLLLYSVLRFQVGVIKPRKAIYI